MLELLFLDARVDTDKTTTSSEFSGGSSKTQSPSRTSSESPNATSSESSAGASSKKKTPNIGAIVGGVVFVAAFAIATFYRRKAKHHSEVDPLIREHRGGGHHPANLVVPYAVNDSDVQPITYSNLRSSRQRQHPTSFPAPSSNPLTSPSHTNLSKALAEARQEDINRRIQAMEQQIRTPRSGGGEAGDWITTAARLRVEIGRLEAALQSQWAQGMSDQPPP